MRYLPCSGWMNSLLAESCRQLPAFGAQELSNLLWAVAVLRVRPGNEWLQEVVHQVASQFGSFNAQEVSTIAWSLAKLRYQPSQEWISALLLHGLDELAGLKPSYVIMLMWALSHWKRNRRWGGGVQPYLAAAGQMLHSFSPSEASMLLWCLAKLAHPPPAWWLTKYATAITAQLHAYTPSNSAVTLSSMGNLPWVPGAELMEQLLQHMKAQLPLFSVKELAAVSQGLSNVYAAAVRLDAVQGVAAAKQKRLTAVQLSQSAAWQVIWADWMVVSQDRLHDAGPQELMIMAVSVAKARGPGVSDAWMGSLYAAVARCWAVADGRLCSGVLWAVVKLKQVPPHNWLLQLLTAAHANMSSLRPQQLSSMAQSMHVLGQRGAMQLDAQAAFSALQTAWGQQQAARDSRGTSPQLLSMSGGQLLKP
eukprot:jgi/Chrzof1/13419/Cz07g32100.t1